MRYRIVPLVLLALVFAPEAGAARCVAPPGTAAIDQYCETVPGAGGDRHKPDAPRPIPASTIDRILVQGGEQAAHAMIGARAAARAQRGAEPGRQRAGESAEGRDGEQSAARARTNDSGNPLKAVVSAVGTGATVQAGLGYALLALTLVLGALALRRARRT